MKSFAIILAILASAPAFAGSVDVTGGIGATTNFIYRGESLSSKRPSANADVRVDLNTGLGVNVFGRAQGDTVSVRGTDTRALGRGEVGLGTDLLGVHVETGVRQNMIFGGVGTDANFREAFVRGALPVLGGVASVEYNRQVQGAEGPFGRGSYTSVGYQRNLDGTPFTMGISGGWSKFNGSGMRFNDVALTSTLHMNSHLDVIATQTVGGHRVDGSQISNQTSVGVRYGF